MFFSLPIQRIFMHFAYGFGVISNATKINWYKISIEFTISDFPLKNKKNRCVTFKYEQFSDSVHTSSLPFAGEKKNTKTQCVEWYVLRVNRRRKKNYYRIRQWRTIFFSVVSLFCSAIFLSQVQKFIRSLKTVHSNGRNRITRKTKRTGCNLSLIHIWRCRRRG